MGTNIFIKSFMRQPVRALLLAVLLAAAAFAFISRATEYIVVEGELTRIENTYRAIGMLAPLQHDDFAVHHDVRRAAELLRPYVALSDERVFTQGVLHDLRNTALQADRGSLFSPNLRELGVYAQCQVFLGILRRGAASVANFGGQPSLQFNIYVAEMLQGDPRALRVGDLVLLDAMGRETVIQGRRDFRLRLTQEEADLFRAGEWDPLEGISMDGKYMFRASPGHIDGTGAVTWYLRSVYGADGLRFYPVYEDGRHWWRMIPDESVRIAPRFFAPAEEAPTLMAAQAEMLAQLEVNSRSVNVIGTQDMSAMPRFANPMHARLLDTARFPGGRWMTYEDHAYARPVVMLPAPLAIRQNVRVGDTITVTLRDTQRPVWIDYGLRTPWAEPGWWDNYPQGWWSTLESAQENWRDFDTVELELEVIGIYWFTPPGLPINNYTFSEIYIPASLIPAGFGWDDAPLLASMYSFVLDSPRSEQAFTATNRAPLLTLGFGLTFLPTRFDQLVQSTDPIRSSIATNLIIFTAVSFMVLALVVFLYIRAFRRGIAIARALGVPKRSVMAGLFAPVVFVWIPAILLGALGGWHFAGLEATDTLAVVAEYEAMATADVRTLIILTAGLLLAVCAAVALAGIYRLFRPVLEQLQGSGARRTKVKAIEPGKISKNFTVGDFSVLQQPVSKTGSRAWLNALRHGTRHIARAPVKTILLAGLALLFVLSLGWLHHTIEFTEREVERLWAETRIEAEIIYLPDLDGAGGFRWWPADISPATWDAMLATGFVTDAYLEALSMSPYATLLGVSHLEGFIAENTKTATDIALGITNEDIVVELMDGFYPEHFVFTPGQAIPTLVRRFTVENGEYSLGSVVRLYTEHAESPGAAFGMLRWLEHTYLHIVGTYEYGLVRGVARWGRPYVMPIDALIHHTSNHPNFVMGGGGLGTGGVPYLTARFISNPAWNRDLQILRDIAAPVLEINQVGHAPIPLILVVDDEVLTNVIAPMEQSLQLFRILYPVAVGSSFVLGFGLALLTMLQSAKNAAILRVLGKKKASARVALCAEQVFVCIAGVALGLALLPVAGVAVGLTPLALAGVYFAGALIGSVLGAILITARSPLSLLQVRE